MMPESALKEILINSDISAMVCLILINLAYKKGSRSSQSINLL
ncbi:hypothetical protein VCRA2127O301_510006 [Vibrio crassostreae]|nr:hypothetical protein VCRA2127O301_510006 [Vibrio crassostreae]CAK3934394.1 hypothetical protein VCRA2120O258_490001 [Vibrio crassostreae]